MTTKVRIMHLDSIDSIKVLVKTPARAATADQPARPETVNSVTPLPGKGDEFEIYVYGDQSIEVQEGAVESAAVSGTDLAVGADPAVGSGGQPGAK